MVYKIIAKALANRLKVHLPWIISDQQNAFVLGRLITDNFIVAFETLHTLRRKTCGRKGYMALKVDMSEAYDAVFESYYVEAGFLRLLD